MTPSPQLHSRADSWREVRQDLHSADAPTAVRLPPPPVLSHDTEQVKRSERKEERTKRLKREEEAGVMKRNRMFIKREIDTNGVDKRWEDIKKKQRGNCKHKSEIDKRVLKKVRQSNVRKKGLWIILLLSCLTAVSKEFSFFSPFFFLQEVIFLVRTSSLTCGMKY